MSYLKRLKAGAEKQPGEEPAKGAKGSFAGFAGSASGHFANLPPDIAAGLARLPSLPSPPLSLPVWPDIVADALRLVNEGWAATALGLGWSPLHLWGAHLDTPGLAVWLCGRRIVLLSETSCTVADGPDRRAVFNCRQPAPGTCFLWEYGRG